MNTFFVFIPIALHRDLIYSDTQVVVIPAALSELAVPNEWKGCRDQDYIESNET